MKLSDYVVSFLESKEVKHIFLLSGGGIMHLLDSVGQAKALEYVCNLHEQAVSYAAEAYGQVTRQIGVALVTTGPGGTNALSGVAAAWADSTPMLVLSGQVKRSDSAVPRKVRQYGLQENNIIDMVRPITKYAITVNEPSEIRFHLEKAWHLATAGRKGPVWIDIPLDVQAAHIDPDTLRGYIPPESQSTGLTPQVEALVDLLRQSERPLFFWGYGVVADGAEKALTALAERLSIPVITSWRAKSAIACDHPLFFGHPGSPAHRSANFILQNSDLLIVVGSRLSPGITAYNEGGFGKNAKRVMVDIDPLELAKMSTPFALKIQASAVTFAAEFSSRCEYIEARPSWLDFCRLMQKKYPVLNDYLPWTLHGVNPYLLLHEISKRLSGSEGIVAASAGQCCTASHLLYDYKPGQLFFNSMGLGAMGYSLPAGVGVCFAAGRKDTFVFDGDGSLQFNVQELQTVKNYDLPIKLFIMNNNAYASIVSMQKRSFGSRFAGANSVSGVTLPELSLVAKAYGIPYFRISGDEEIEGILSQIFAQDGPCLCDIIVSEDMEEYPRTMTHIGADGSICSDDLENLWPYLSKGEIQENMKLSEE